MATTNFDQLDELAGNVFFRNCNQAELDGDHTFYGEDLARLIEDQQPDAKGVKKFVASFGASHTWSGWLLMPPTLLFRVWLPSLAHLIIRVQITRTIFIKGMSWIKIISL